jgi:two-component system LytT family response regulator
MATILIHTRTEAIKVPLHNIIRIESKSNYSKIYFADKSYPLTVSKVLGWFEKQLPDDVFLRIHRTHLVNKQFISTHAATGESILLNNGEKINVSRRKKQLLKGQLAN